MSPDSTYPAPEHGWTCFHCGETFMNPNLARAHFGAVPSAVPACIIKRSERGLVYTLRDLERERDELRVRLEALRLGCDEAECVELFRASREPLP